VWIHSVVNLGSRSFIPLRHCTTSAGGFSDVAAMPYALLTLTGTDWTVARACRTVDNASELFFSDDFADIRVANLICAKCPVMAQCLEVAFDRGEPCGVWGGQLFEDGKIVTVKRRRGRPPKNPGPEDQLPTIPVPEQREYEGHWRLFSTLRVQEFSPHV
jgi:WhiB family redox-sensing transcriptional regulator